MSRIVVGAFGTLLFIAAGLFWLQGRAEVERGAPPPELALEKPAGDGQPQGLPSADVTDLRGPAPPEATELSREQRRFASYDRDSDGRITRNEMMSRRTSAFRQLDKDGNNLLTFEEWAVTTGDKFREADANGDLWLSPEEFATTRPKKRPKPKCNC